MADNHTGVLGLKEESEITPFGLGGHVRIRQAEGCAVVRQKLTTAPKLTRR